MVDSGTALSIAYTIINILLELVRSNKSLGHLEKYSVYQVSVLFK